MPENFEGHSNPNLPALHVREKILAEMSVPGASDPESLCSLFEVPQNLRGKTVLDIGSGASPFIHELERRGAKAVGLDPVYENSDNIKEYWWRNKGNPNLNTLEHNKLADKFSELFKQGKLRLVAGLAGSLPFANNSFDFIYSHFGLTHMPARDPEVIKNAFQEAYRVLKPGGKILAFPSGIPPTSFYNEETINAMKSFLEYIQQSGLEYTLKVPDDFRRHREEAKEAGMQMLVVTKPKPSFGQWFSRFLRRSSNKEL